jgi:hypothetical protein
MLIAVILLLLNIIRYYRSDVPFTLTIVSLCDKIERVWGYQEEHCPKLKYYKTEAYISKLY